MLFRTPLFIACGTPSSYSNPLAPPSPEMSSSFRFSSSSTSAIVFFLLFLLECSLLLKSQPLSHSSEHVVGKRTVVEVFTWGAFCC